MVPGNPHFPLSPLYLHFAVLFFSKSCCELSCSVLLLISEHPWLFSVLSLNLARLEYPSFRVVLYLVCLCEQGECLRNASLKDKYPQLSISESHLDHSESHLGLCSEEIKASYAETRYLPALTVKFCSLSVQIYTVLIFGLLSASLLSEYSLLRSRCAAYIGETEEGTPNQNIFHDWGKVNN